MRFRVFAALELPRENQERLGEVLLGLEAAAPPRTVHWVRPEAIHLTLKFYGDVAEADRPGIEAALAEAAAGARPLQLSLEGLGVFPNARRPQVVWTGLGGELEPLLALQAALAEKSAALGFAPEARAFVPHLTLGRIRGALRPEEHITFMEHLSAHRADWFGEFRAEALSLVRSDPRPLGSVYTSLFAASLGGQLAPPEARARYRTDI